MIIKNVLGEEKSVIVTYPDGSYKCPFCECPTKDACNNPACSAATHMTVKLATELRERQRRADESEAERQKIIRIQRAMYA
jgi:hypothetical protein